MALRAALLVLGTCAALAAAQQPVKRADGSVDSKKWAALNALEGADAARDELPGSLRFAGISAGSAAQPTEKKLERNHQIIWGDTLPPEMLMPGTDMFARGYDIVKNAQPTMHLWKWTFGGVESPHTQEHKSQVKLIEVPAAPDGGSLYWYPDQVEARTYVQCDMVSTERAYSSAGEYSQELAQNMNVDVDVIVFAFKMDQSYKEASKRMSSGSTKLVVSSAMCEINGYELLEARLHPEFRAGLKGMVRMFQQMRERVPVADDASPESLAAEVVADALSGAHASTFSSGIYDFFDNFGTHLMRNARFGGVVEMRSFVSDSEFSKSTSSSFSLSVEAKVTIPIKNVKVTPGGSYSQSQSSENTRQTSSSSSNVFVRAVGGTPGAFDGSMDSWTEWADSLELNPVPVKPNLEPLSKAVDMLSEADLASIGLEPRDRKLFSSGLLHMMHAYVRSFDDKEFGEYGVFVVVGDEADEAGGNFTAGSLARMQWGLAGRDGLPPAATSEHEQEEKKIGVGIGSAKEAAPLKGSAALTQEQVAETLKMYKAEVERDEKEWKEVGKKLHEKEKVLFKAQDRRNEQAARGGNQVGGKVKGLNMLAEIDKIKADLKPLRQEYKKYSDKILKLRSAVLRLEELQKGVLGSRVVLELFGSNGRSTGPVPVSLMQGHSVHHFKVQSVQLGRIVRADVQAPNHLLRIVSVVDLTSGTEYKFDFWRPKLRQVRDSSEKAPVLVPAQEPMRLAELPEFADFLLKHQNSRRYEVWMKTGMAQYLSRTGDVVVTVRGSQGEFALPVNLGTERFWSAVGRGAQMATATPGRTSLVVGREVVRVGDRAGVAAQVRSFHDKQSFQASSAGGTGSARWTYVAHEGMNVGDIESVTVTVLPPRRTDRSVYLSDEPCRVQVRVAREICQGLVCSVHDEQTDDCMSVQTGLDGRAPTFETIENEHNVVGVNVEACEQVKKVMEKGMDRPDIRHPFRCRFSELHKTWERFDYKPPVPGADEAKHGTDEEAKQQAADAHRRAEEETGAAKEAGEAGAEDEASGVEEDGGGKMDKPCMKGTFYGVGARGWLRDLLNIGEDEDTCNVLFASDVHDAFSQCPIFTTPPPVDSARSLQVHEVVVVATGTHYGVVSSVKFDTTVKSGSSATKRAT